MTDEEKAREYAITRTYPNFKTDCLANFMLNEIEEVCHEEEDYYTFTLGHFNNEEFVGVLQWDSEYGEDLFDYIKE